MWRAGRIDLCSEAVPPSTIAAICLNLFERSELNLLRSFLPRDRAVVDLGAGIGVTSFVARRRIADGHPVVAVEANPALLDVLGKVHSSSPNTTVLNCAISGAEDSQATVQFRLSSGSHLGSRQVPQKSGPSLSSDVTVNVSSSPLSEVVARFIPDGPYSIISDIEGAESTFLIDPPPVFDRCSHLIIELHSTTWQGQALSIADLRDAIVSHGFRCVARERTVYAFVRN